MSEPVVAPAVLRPKQAAQYIGTSLQTFWRWSKQEDFPKVFKMGEASSGVLKSDLDAWLQAKREGK